MNVFPMTNATVPSSRTVSSGAVGTWRTASTGVVLKVATAVLYETVWPTFKRVPDVKGKRPTMRNIGRGEGAARHGAGKRGF